MALANVNVTLTEPNVSVSSDNVNVSVASNTSTITVSNINVTSNTDIRNAITFTNVNSSGGLNYSQANGDITYNLYGDNGIDIGANGLVSVKFAINDNYLEIAGLNNGLRTKASSLFPIEELVVADANGTTSFSNVIVGNGNAGGVTGTLQANSNNFMFKHGTGTGHLDGNFHMATNDLPVSNVGHGVNYSVSNANVSFRHSNLVFTPGPNGEIGYIGGAQMSNVPGDVSSAPHITGNTITVQNDGKIQFGGLSYAEIYKSDSTSLTMRNLSGNLILHTDLFTNSNVMLGTPATPANVRVATNSVGGVPQGPSGNLHVDNSVIAGYYHGDGSNITGVSSLTNAQVVAHIATVPLTVGGNLQVNGNIDATGNINYQNVTDLYVTDQKITLNANATTDATVEIISFRPQAGADTKLRWNETTDIWEFTNDGSTFYPIPTSTTDLAEGTNLYYTDSRFDTRLGTKTTDNLTEGSTNQYYTDSRFDTRLGTKTTDNLTEGSTNQYYTDARSRAAVSVTSNTPSGNGSLSYDNGTGVFTFTPADTSAGGGGGITNAQAQAFIQSSGLAMTANITSNSLIQTTGNLQVNPDTEINGLKGLTFDSTNNFLGLGTTTPGTLLDGSSQDSALHIFCDDQFHGTITIEESRNSTSGPELNFAKAWDDGGTPSSVGNGNRLGELNYFGYDGTDMLERGAFRAYVDFPQQSGFTVDPGNIPVGWEFVTSEVGNLAVTGGSTAPSVFKVRANGTIQVGEMDPTSSNVGTKFQVQSSGDTQLFAGSLTVGAGNVELTGNLNATGATLTGAVTSDSNITTTANVSGNYILGNGSQLTGIVAGGSTDSFGTVTVSGQTNIQASQANAILDIASTGDITLTTSGNTLTIGGSGGAYGNTEVEAFLSSGTITGNIETSGFHVGDLDGAVLIDVNNNTGSTLSKGAPVYLTGGNSGDNPNVALANAQIASQMPAIGLVYENISNSTIGQVVVSGVMNYTSHGITPGADFYVSPVAIGGLTETKPTGEANAIQKLGKAVSTNHVMVQGAFRSNDTPNLDQNKIFIGNSANRVETVALDNLTQNLKTTGNLQVNPDTLVGGLKGLTFDATTNRLGLGTTTPEYGLHIVSDGDIDSQLFMDEYSTSSSANDIRMRRAEGSLSAPRFVNSGDHIGQWYHYPWRENADPTGNAAFSDTYGGLFATTGGVEISSFADGDYLINHIPVGNLTAQGGSLGDRLKLTDQTIRFNDGTIFVLDGTTNPNLTSLNGQAFYVDQGGGSTSRTYDLYYDEARTQPVQVATGTEDFTDGNANVVATAQPVGLEIIINEDTVDRFSQRRITKWRANGTMEFGATSTDDGTGAAASITTDGVFTTSGNITTTANVSGLNILGNGSNLTGIDLFKTISVSGQSDVVADSISDTLTLAAGSGMTITTDAGTDTITFEASGGGGNYGNTDVQTWLNSGNNTGDIKTAGNLIVSGQSGTVQNTIGSYFGSDNTGSDDQIIPGAPDPGWADGTALTMSGTTNPDLTFLNGNVYYTKATGGGEYSLYTDSGLTTALVSGLGSEAPTGLIASYTGTVDIEANITGDLNVTSELSVTGATSLASAGANTDVGGDLVMQAGTNLHVAGFQNIGGGTINAASFRVTDFKANDPLGVQQYTNTALGSVSGFAGAIIFVVGDRAVDGEGVPAYWSGSQWKYFSDNANVSYT